MSKFLRQHHKKLLHLPLTDVVRLTTGRHGDDRENGEQLALVRLLITNSATMMTEYSEHLNVSKK